MVLLMCDNDCTLKMMTITNPMTCAALVVVDDDLFECVPHGASSVL